MAPPTHVPRRHALRHERNPMPRPMLALIASLLLAAACGRHDDEPGRGARRDRAAAPDCDDAAGHLAVTHPLGAGADGLPRLAQAMSEACVAQAWSAEVRACLAGVTHDAAAADACLAKLDPAMRTAAITGFERAARDLGSQHATW